MQVLWGVTLDGEGPISSSQSIELTSPADNKINFVLKNFILQAGMGGEAGQSVPVGNIKITDIDLVGTNGNYTFTKTANIKIEAGDKEGIASDAWMGPIISGTSGIPVTLKGTITGNDIKLDITIPFMNMNIAVQFFLEQRSNFQKRIIRYKKNTELKGAPYFLYLIFYGIVANSF